MPPRRGGQPGRITTARLEDGEPFYVRAPVPRAGRGSVRERPAAPAESARPMSGYRTRGNDHDERCEDMGLGRLLLRLAIGGTFFVHGTQKLFGWFGGYGPEGTGGFFESLGLRPGKRHAVAAGWTETAGGTLIALGFNTPVAAAGVTAVMITALRKAIWNQGIKPATGEFEVLLAAGALALTDTGPGPLSLDAARGVERTGTGWTLAALGAAAAGSFIATELASEQAPPSAPASTGDQPATPEAPPAPHPSTS